MSKKSKRNKIKKENPSAIRQQLEVLRNPWKMKWFYVKRLPSVGWWGIRVQYIDQTRSEIYLPYNWRTQNPFRSIYFAAQLGAGELSTGLLALLALAGKKPVSMLVVNMEATFTKKANKAIVFHCTEGVRIQEAVQRAIDSGEGQKVVIETVGRMADGTEVSSIKITWSFKAKA